MSVKEILKDKASSVLSIEEDRNVLEATQMMVGAKVGSLIVTFQGKLVGIFTERDLMRVVAKDHNKLDQIKLKDVMTTQLTVAGPEEDVDDILNNMITKRFRHMPVLDGDKIIGLISIGDAVKTKLNKTQAEMNILREYMYGPH
ncbi:CBS domain-containing protein [Leptospira biflexa]|jgi:CBS domain-containing protein|uniref:CBS domain-containing protein n=2 Tax=Leptospira TaxID=171 RepID=A0A7I0HRF9_9LEPT|nr:MULTISPECIES: CBS domain-containing protein [Leptospira]ABZ94739.1 Signal transduction protein containing cAMP- binding and CBS domains [Leptospira biflexa serovar Patoc strain 'Patoc 1 (Ames)']ABZ98407.1 Putative CBS domain protein [Leptospira biflexa serovar Patoc strain 'Patoc 1 (Paris)']TGK52317.1 CBS domain-containing protein [Leptospira bouyouniensis]TGL04882.1 CBS domain-containing protein [Leptospira bouyouniensis]TGM31028.1 CBS domain-containing protein [Leptospira biflexa]